MSELGKVIEVVEAARDDLAENCTAIKSNKGESLAAAYHPMAVEMFGLAVCPHIDTLIAAAKRAEQAEAEVGRWKAEAMAARGLLHDSGLHIYAQHTEGQCATMDDAAHEYVNERAANNLTPPPTANEGATTLEGAGGEVRADAPSEAVEGV